MQRCFLFFHTRKSRNILENILENTGIIEILMATLPLLLFSPKRKIWFPAVVDP